VPLYFVASRHFKKRERWARDVLLAASLAWFALDTGLSAYHGVTHNVIIDLALFALASVPIALNVREFGR
jgi:hypothetical protein